MQVEVTSMNAHIYMWLAFCVSVPNVVHSVHSAALVNMFVHKGGGECTQKHMWLFTHADVHAL